MKFDIKKRIKEVLEKGYVMSLSTRDKNGVWCSDVIYIFDSDLNIYWFSDPEARHSKAIHKNKQVAGTITVSRLGENDLGIQFSGYAERLKGRRWDLCVKHLRKCCKIVPKKAIDVLQGDCWYALHPEKFGLIDEKNFGWDRQEVRL